MPSYESLEHELATQAHILTKALESQLLTGRMSDPLEKMIGTDGEVWELVNGYGEWQSETCAPYKNDQELSQVRRVCRTLASDHPFAICGHENRISYVIGEGHSYSVEALPRIEVSEDDIERVQDVVDAFLEENEWHSRQQETMLRLDRDGETFLRMFPGQDGILRVRFIEPHAVRTPERHDGEAEFAYGIQTDPEDSETVLAYWVNDEPLDPMLIQHRKRGLDSSCRRGVPIFWSVRHNLIRASKILRNGSTVTELQTAIGMIRRFEKAASSTVSAWLNSTANIKQTSSDPGFGQNGTNSRLSQEFAPGTILNASQNMEYDFPAMGVDPSKYVESLQAELRAVAARLVMPEFMFTAKSDDVNRAAAFAAEGPSTKMFKRLQWHTINSDLKILKAQLSLAVQAGVLSQELVDSIEINASPPSVVTKDSRIEAETRGIDMANGILSVQTASREAGYDYAQEQANIEEHDERTGALPAGAMAPPLPPAPGEPADEPDVEEPDEEA